MILSPHQNPYTKANLKLITDLNLSETIKLYEEKIGEKHLKS